MRKTVLSNFQSLSSASTLPIALMIANIASFAFNAYLGRTLSFSDFGVITFLSSLWYLLSIPINAVGTTITYKIAFLSGKEGKEAADSYFVYFSKKIFTPVIALSIIWILITPLISQFFHVSAFIPILLFSPAIYLGTYSLVHRSYIQGKLLFFIVSLTIIIENVSKLLFAFLFVGTGLQDLTYLSIPLSILLAYISAAFFVSKQKITKVNIQTHTFPKEFFTASIFSNIATTAFITIDVILVKHFFNATLAGEYSLLSLIGKMIYFFGTLLNGILFTYVSNLEGARKNPVSVFNKILPLAAIATIGMFVVLGPLGSFITPILFGNKITVIAPYLTIYSLGIALFTISNIIATYYLAKQKYVFSVIGIATALTLATVITLFHQDLLQIAYEICLVSLLSLIITLTTHIIISYKNV